MQNQNLNSAQGAYVSECGKYRYALWRTWDCDLQKVLFIGLNPSTADAIQDDPTLRRCIHFAKAWGFGGLFMGNLFAWRIKNPRQLEQITDPVGPETDAWLELMHSLARITIAAWGNHGYLNNRGEIVHRRFPGLYNLGLTKPGHPRHPLYTKKDLTFHNWP